MSITDTTTLPPYVRLSVAAELLDCSEATIRRLIARGEIHAARVGTKMLRISTESLLSAAEPIKAAK